MKGTFLLDDLIRDNVKRLIPYSSARNEFSGNASVYLDANENPYENGVNRYPDPFQNQLKKRIAEIKSVSADQMILGNGSDEVIDLLFRAFCEPNVDNVIVCTPTYGMYEVAANINAVEIKSVALDADFQPDIVAVKNAADANSNLLFLCSPNNPTANLYEVSKVKQLLESFNGLVIVDEAYIDFAQGNSLVDKLKNYPNLVVLQTLSKAWGMAAIRLGIGFAAKEIISVLNRIKPPYNVNHLSQEKALELLKDEDKYQHQVDEIIRNREKLKSFVEQLTFVQKTYASDANFILLKVDKAKELYEFLLARGIIIRNRSSISGLENCVRISVGTHNENELLCEALLAYQKNIES